MWDVMNERIKDARNIGHNFCIITAVNDKSYNGSHKGVQ